MRPSGLAHLKPFLPGLEPLLEDAEVSEIMINGPGNVWIEARGRRRLIAAPGARAPAEPAAPGLDESALLRAAIHIARPLGLDPATTPIMDESALLRAAIHIARLWAWTRPPRPSLMPALMMGPAWRSVFPRPVPTLRSPSGDSASGRLARRIWSSRNPCRETS